MKKKIYLLATILTATAALFLSSCLKDNSHYINFNTGTTFVDFPLGGFTNYSTDAITETPDTDANGTIVRQFAVNVASANLPTKPTVVTLAVGGQSDVDALNKLQSNVSFVLLPSNAYSFTTTTVTIPAGKQYVTTSITFYKNLLDPAVSYALPVKIVSGTGAQLTANLNIHYFHFIGNDFAGAYEHYFTRWSKPDTTGSYATTTPGDTHADEGTDTFFPVSSNEFTVVSDYYTALLPYHVSFTKTGTGASAMYSNWAISFKAADIAQYWTGAGISLGAGPFFDPNPTDFPGGFDPTKSYTYAQSLKIFRFYYTTATRAVIDQYIHP